MGGDFDMETAGDATVHVRTIWAIGVIMEYQRALHLYTQHHWFIRSIAIRFDFYSRVGVRVRSALAPDRWMHRSPNILINRVPSCFSNQRNLQF